MSSPTDQPFAFVPNYGPWMTSVIEHGFYKTWINSMTPERLAQYKAHKQKYNQEHKERINERCRARYQQNKERLNEKHVCETCGGRYTTAKRAQHVKTKQHQDALASVSPTCFICEICRGRFTDKNKAAHYRTKKHQAALQILPQANI